MRKRACGKARKAYTEAIPSFSYHHSFSFPFLPGALIPSLRRTDKLGDRFTEDQLDAILENFQNVLLGLQQGPGVGAGGGGGEEEGMDTSGYQEDDDL